MKKSRETRAKRSRKNEIPLYFALLSSAEKDIQKNIQQIQKKGLTNVSVYGIISLAGDEKHA